MLMAPVVGERTAPALHEHVDVTTGRRSGEPTELDSLVDRIIDSMPVLSEDDGEDLARLLALPARV